MVNYTAGILMIGSLVWDRRDHRVSWRRNRLKAAPGIPVQAPIRYGRISKDREKTYTMVFSIELLPARVGWALVMPCRCPVINADHLVQEAQALWAAEQPTPSIPGPLSASWGAVGLFSNPRCTTLDTVRTGWTERVAEEQKHYAEFLHSNGEVAAVSPDGVLAIPWPTTESGHSLDVDVLLAIATVPSLHNGSYATPEAIAEAWKRAPKQQRYFDENRRVGITTADDYRIMNCLCQESA